MAFKKTFQSNDKFFMENNVFQLSNGIEDIYRSKLQQ